MERVLKCDCGFVVRAGDEPEFVALARRHALEIHGMQLSAEEVLQLACRAEQGTSPSEERLGP